MPVKLEEIPGTELEVLKTYCSSLPAEKFVELFSAPPGSKEIGGESMGGNIVLLPMVWAIPVTLLMLILLPLLLSTDDPCALRSNSR